LNHSAAWWAELWGTLAGAAVVLLAGFVTGQLGVCIAIGVCVYALRHLYYLYCLGRWLAHRKQHELPYGNGVWRELFRQLYRLQRRARKRKKRLKAIIDRFQEAARATPDAAVILRADGRIAWLNSAAERLLGLRYPRDVGQPIGDLVRVPAFGAYLQSGEYEEPLEMVSPEDEEVALSVRVAPYGEDRRLLLARDVTRLARLEQMRKDFVANVSHELRSPLTVIRGYLEALASSGDDVPVRWRRPVERMEEQTGRMCRIVEDLLKLSRLEGGRDPGSEVPVMVGYLLDTLRRDALSLTGENLRIDITADTRHCLLGDYNELYSAFSNLLFNAVQYTPVENEISLRWRVGEGGEGVIEVEDTGIGIDPEHLPRLTERFYRVDKARSREVGGTGLGLSIVKHVLARHGGSLEVESEPGEGSVFRCRFPVERVAAVPAAAEAGN